MAVSDGYGKTTNKGLVFAYDVNDTHNSYKGEPTTNLYTGGHFPNGNDMPQEDGRTPTNDIVQLSNPGESGYVLKQNGTNTEYELLVSSGITSSTTYCLSGWFTTSLDYDGSETMFHCRAYSSSGSHTTLGTGIYNVVKSKVVN